MAFELGTQPSATEYNEYSLTKVTGGIDGSHKVPLFGQEDEEFDYQVNFMSDDLSNPEFFNLTINITNAHVFVNTITIKNQTGTTVLTFNPATGSVTTTLQYELIDGATQDQTLKVNMPIDSFKTYDINYKVEVTPFFSGTIRWNYKYIQAPHNVMAGEYIRATNSDWSGYSVRGTTELKQNLALEGRLGSTLVSEG